MPNEHRILVVDDADAARAIAVQALSAAGYVMIEADCGARALEMVASRPPAMVVLDVCMPGMDGYEVAGHLRQSGYLKPLLMLTSYDDEDHQVRGLTAGADDYVTKPYNLRVLIARVNALLRRDQVPAPRVLRFGSTVVNLAQKQALCGGEPVALTRKEFAMLTLLAQHAGTPVARKDLLTGVWGYAAEANTRTVETHMWRLRKKLGDDSDEPRWIVTRPGMGYMLTHETTEVTPTLLAG